MVNNAKGEDIDYDTLCKYRIVIQRFIDKFT